MKIPYFNFWECYFTLFFNNYITGLIFLIRKLLKAKITASFPLKSLVKEIQTHSD